MGSASAAGRPNGKPGLRVLLTCDAVGGVWTYGLDLGRALGRAGAEVTLAVLGPAPSGDQIREAVGIGGLALAVTGLPLDWTAGTPAEIEAAARDLAGLAAETGADLVHLHGGALAAGAVYPVPVLATAHSCVRTWWEAVRPGETLTPDLAWRADLTGRGYAACHRLVAPSRAFAEATARAYGLAVPPTAIPNGREPPRAPAIAEGPVHAFTAGRLWDEGKNLAILDAAASGLAIPVLAAGPTLGPNGAAVAPRHVRALGRLSATGMAERLAARPIFVSTALYEPFGLAVLEAAGHGCPLVLSDIPTFRELWEGAALLVDPRDAAGVADAIRGLAASPSRRRELGWRARERAARYGLEAMAAATLGTYREVLGGSGRPGTVERPAAAARRAAA